MAALGGHKRFSHTLECGHSISWEGGIDLIYREDSTHGEVTATLRGVDAAHMHFLLLLGVLQG